MNEAASLLRAAGCAVAALPLGVAVGPVVACSRWSGRFETTLAPADSASLHPLTVTNLFTDGRWWWRRRGRGRGSEGSEAHGECAEQPPCRAQDEADGITTRAAKSALQDMQHRILLGEGNRNVGWVSVSASTKDPVGDSEEVPDDDGDGSPRPRGSKAPYIPGGALARGDLADRGTCAESRHWRRTAARSFRQQHGCLAHGGGRARRRDHHGQRQTREQRLQQAQCAPA
jgi:hypothetical protein